MRWLWVTFLFFGCSDVSLGPRDGKNGGFDTGEYACEIVDSPELQLGDVGAFFQPWQEGAPIVFETASEGGLSFPFGLASRNTRDIGRYDATLSLQDGTYLAGTTNEPVSLLCTPNGQLVSDPQRLTVGWEGDDFDLFAVPVRFEVSLRFSNGLELNASFDSEISF